MHTDLLDSRIVADPGDSLAPGITPGQVASTETEGTSTSRGGLTPGAQQRLDAGRAVEQGAATGLVDVAKQAGALAEQKARVEQEKADRAAAVGAEFNQRRLAAMDAADRDLSAARAASKQAFDDYRKMTIPDFFSDKDPATGETKKNWGRVITAAITVGLGGLTQRSNGGRNMAMETLDKTIDQYFAREREKVLKARDVASEAKGNISDVASQGAAALKQLDIKEAAARSTIADEMAKRMAALGVPQAAIVTNKDILEQQQKAAEKLQKVDDSERTHIVSTHTKALQQPGTGMIFGEGGKPLVDVGDKGKAKEINAVIANFRDMSAGLRELRDLDKQGLSVPLVGDLAQRREALRSSLLIKAKEQANLGALSAGDMSIVESQLGGRMADTTGRGRGERLDEMDKLLQRTTGTFLDGQGLSGAAVIAKVVPRTGTATVPASSKTQPTDDGRAAAARRVMNDPSAPDAARKAAMRYLQQVNGAR